MGQRGRVCGFNNIKAQLRQAHRGGARFHFIMDDVGDARMMQGSHFRTEFGAGYHRDVRVGALDLHVGGQGRGGVREREGDQPRGADSRQVHGDLVLDVP